VKSFRLLIAGGGTGGHITPGVAVMEAVRHRVHRLHTLWVGVEGRREEDMVPRFGIPLTTMRLCGLERSLHPGAVFRNIKTGLAWTTLKPVLQARTIIREFEPDFVLGTGGYVCAPVMVAARWLKIRTWILEQNSAPGFTVRRLARWVDGVGIAYDITRERLPPTAPVELVGNPVLRSILTARREAGIREFQLDDRLRTVLVMGGSLGSTALNTAVKELLSIHHKSGILKGWQMLHAVGHKKYDAYIKEIPRTPDYHPYAFIYNAPSALAASDLVICRGGAMTLAEVTARGIPSIVVPWPGAVRDHQTTNARSLEQTGASILIPESELTGTRLSEIFYSFATQPRRLADMAARAREAGRPEAAERVADFILAGDRD